MVDQHEKYMRRCLELARMGQSECAPNPMVGAILVYQDKIIGEGYHQKYGEAHAEVNAINSVSSEDQHLIPKATLYVSLEPCAHFGKTPPCSQLIIEQKIPKVVIGCQDSFAEVAGKGIQMLRHAGIDVVVDVLEKEARTLNKRFFTFHEKKRPFVILKMAVSANGMMDVNRQQNKKGIFWITSPEFQTISHQWRSEEQAILVGYNTVINDNPSLTVRAIKGRNPIRVAVSRNTSLPSDSSILSDEAPTIIVNQERETEEGSNLYLATQNTVQDILLQLYNQNINSVIIEGGPQTLQKFIDANLWDEARVIRSKEVTIANGIPAPVFSAREIHQIDLEQETISIFTNT